MTAIPRLTDILKVTASSTVHGPITTAVSITEVIPVPIAATAVMSTAIILFPMVPGFPTAVPSTAEP